MPGRAVVPRRSASFVASVHPCCVSPDSAATTLTLALAQTFHKPLFFQSFRHGNVYVWYTSTQCQSTLSKYLFIIHVNALRLVTKIQGGPIKTTHFFRYHMFAATTDIITRFLLKCSEITAKNNNRHFYNEC